MSNERSLSGAGIRHRPLQALMAACFGALTLSACLDDRPLRPLSIVFFDAGEGGEDGTSGEGGSSAEAGAPSQEGGAAGEGGHGAAPSGGGGSGNTSGAGGTASGNAGVSGSGGALTQGGSAGQPSNAGACGCSGGGGGAHGRCPDLDGNSVLDCDETVILNPSFDSTLQTRSWLADTDLELRWDERDAHGNTNSGSLIVENQAEADQDNESMLGARQCIPVVAGAIYHFAAQVSVPDGAGEGRGGFQVTVYASPACVGEIVRTFETEPQRGSAWNAAKVTYIAAATAQSLSMRLVAVKPFRDPPLAVSFDNILVRME
jgi:hypothetical protein